jgi:prevent-host-death family protein
MLTVKIAELKNNLSRYLRAVRRGERVEILDRDVPIARITPIDSEGVKPGAVEKADRAFLRAQVDLGILREGTGKIPRKLLDRPPPGRPGVLAELIAERRRCR